MAGRCMNEVGENVHLRSNTSRYVVGKCQHYFYGRSMGRFVGPSFI